VASLLLPAPSMSAIAETENATPLPEHNSKLVSTEENGTPVEMATGAASKGKSTRVRWKRPRYSRRVESKSEPSAGSGRDA